MAEDEEDVDIYTEEGREEEEESDEIDELEEGFMKGYKEANLAECNTCGRVLENEENVVEIEFDDETYRFCSERCAEKFRRKNKIE